MKKLISVLSDYLEILSTDALQLVYSLKRSYTRPSFTQNKLGEILA